MNKQQRYISISNQLSQATAELQDFKAHTYSNIHSQFSMETISISDMEYVEYMENKINSLNRKLLKLSNNSNKFFQLINKNYLKKVLTNLFI